MPLVHAIRNEDLRREITALEETILHINNLSYRESDHALVTAFDSARQQKIKNLLQKEYRDGNHIFKCYLETILVPAVERALQRRKDTQRTDPADISYCKIEYQCSECPPESTPPRHLKKKEYTFEDAVVEELSQQGPRSDYWPRSDYSTCTHASDLTLMVTNERLAIDGERPCYMIRSNLKGGSLAMKLINRFYDYYREPQTPILPIWDLYRCTVTVSPPHARHILHTIHEELIKPETNSDRNRYNNEIVKEEINRVNALLGKTATPTTEELAIWSVPRWDGRLVDKDGNPIKLTDQRLQKYLAEQVHEWYGGIPIEIQLETDAARKHNQGGVFHHYEYRQRMRARHAETKHSFLALRDFLEKTSLFNRCMIVRNE